jgi:hypothetical protein
MQQDHLLLSSKDVGHHGPAVVINRMALSNASAYRGML